MKTSTEENALFRLDGKPLISGLFSRMISELSSDMVVVIADNHCRVLELADGSRSPVVCMADNMFELPQVLADVLTIYEQFGRTSGLLLAWVGPNRPMFNSYLGVLPHFGMDINYFWPTSHVSMKLLFKEICVLPWK
jgi:ornithine carbamoyltransferase